MMDVDPRSYLLFFDTFCHEKLGDTQIDVVQFAKPVVITEVRLIPLGVAVRSELRGESRLGATNPARFEAEFYTNNLQKMDAATLTCIGSMLYDDRDRLTYTKIDSPIPCTLFLVRGRYGTLSIALFGNVCGDSGAVPAPVPAPSSVPPAQFNHPPPPLPASSSVPPVRSNVGMPPPPFTTAVIPPVMSSVVQSTPAPVPPVAVMSNSFPRHQNGGPSGMVGHGTMPQASNNAVGGGLGSMKRTFDNVRDVMDNHPPRSHGSIQHGGRSNRSQAVTQNQSQLEPGEIYDSTGPSDLWKDPSQANTGSRRKEGSSRNLESSEGDRPFRGSGGNNSGGGGPGGTNVGGNVGVGGSVGVASAGGGILGSLYEDGEIQDVGEYEEISSDEDIFSMLDNDDHIPLATTTLPSDEAIDEEEWLRLPSTQFQPENAILDTLQLMPDPSLTSFEVERSRWIEGRESADELPKATRRVLDLVERFCDPETHGSAWVTAVEQAVPCLPSGLAYLSANDSETTNAVVNTLVHWTIEGLDLERALSQAENTFILRHIKMGIALSGAMTTLDAPILDRLLEQGVLHRLLDLLAAPHMSSSLRLQLVRALDLATRLSNGVEAFLGLLPASGKSETPYQRLVKLALERSKAVRFAVACKRLLNKMHAYELCLNFRDALKNVRLLKKGEKRYEEELAEMTERADSLLTELECLLLNAESTLGHPRHALPCRVLFDERSRPHDPYPNLYHLLHSVGFLETLKMIICSLPPGDHFGVQRLYSTSLRVLANLTRVNNGLAFVASRARDVHEVAHHLLSKFGAEESQGRSVALQLIYKLCTLRHVDHLLLLHREAKLRRDSLLEREPLLKELEGWDLELVELMKPLHGLFLLLSGHVHGEKASRWVSQVLTSEQALDALLILRDVVERPDAPAEEAKPQQKRSVVSLFIAAILTGVVRHADNVSYLGRLGARLLAVADLHDWLSPTKEVPEAQLLDCEVALPQYCDHLRAYVEDSNREVPVGVVTALRLLRQMVIPAREPWEEGTPLASNTDHGPTYVKFNYALTELYSRDGLDLLFKMVEKVTGFLLVKWQQGLEHMDHRYQLILAVLEPTTAMIEVILLALIRARDSEYKDTTGLRPLIHCFIVLCSAPSAFLLSDRVGKIRRQLVGALLAFTQAALPTEESEGALEANLWTVMLREVLKNALTSPYAFHGSMALLSELLPIPLPVHVFTPLTEAERRSLLTSRQLWSAHLLCVEGELRACMRVFGGSSNPQLCQMVRRVSSQVADLSAPCALMLARIVAENLQEACEQEESDAAPPVSEETKEEAVEAAERQTEAEGAPPAQPETKMVHGDLSEVTRCLSHLSQALNIAKVKHAFLMMLSSRDAEGDATNKYEAFFVKLISELLKSNIDHKHMAAQEVLLKAIQHLLDIDIVLDYTEKYSLQNLVNALPTPDILERLCQQLFHHVDDVDQDLSTVHVALKALVVLAAHDLGFSIVHRTIANHSKVFLNLISRVNNTFSKDSPDCLTTLLTTLELLRTLVISDSLEGEAMPLRTMCITVLEVKELLDWKSEEAANDTHPVIDLHSLLKEYAKDEQSLEGLLESMDSLIFMLRTADDGQKIDILTPEVPPMETLEDWFSKRSISTDIRSESMKEATCRLSDLFWFSPPSVLPGMEEEMETPALSRCDLVNLAYVCCPDLNLQEELERSHEKGGELDAVKHKKRRRGKDTIIHTGSKSNKKFVAPMRGRGFGLRSSNMSGSMMTSHGMRNNDNFRSRPPNTSRPPSMHVDDFVKLEQEDSSVSCGAGSDAPRTSRANTGMGRGGRRGGFQRPSGGGVGGGGWGGTMRSFASGTAPSFGVIGGAAFPPGWSDYSLAAGMFSTSRSSLAHFRYPDMKFMPSSAAAASANASAASAMAQAYDRLSQAYASSSYPQHDYDFIRRDRHLRSLTK